MLNLQMRCNVKNFRRLKNVGRHGSVVQQVEFIYFWFYRCLKSTTHGYDVELKMGC
jgi:hypothetical protein